MTQLQKATQLVQLLVSNPAELWERVRVLSYAKRQQRAIAAHGRPAYEGALTLDAALRRLDSLLAAPVSESLSEAAFVDFESHIIQRTIELGRREHLPFPLFFNADPTQRSLAYALCRAVRPQITVETGVAYGVTTESLLTALETNGHGTLHSIDLPPFDDRQATFVGAMVRSEHRSSWSLRLGTSGKHLPNLLDSVGSVDLFIHDSANVAEIQTMELETVWPRLAPGGAILLNNVGGSAALRDFVTRHEIHEWLVIEQREKRGDLSGILIKR